jgi:regulatory protein
LSAHAAEADPAVVLAAAMRLLETRSRTVSDLRARLTRSGYPLSLVDPAIARLVEIGLLDDEAYARSWLESRDRARPRGERALRQELRLRGVPAEVATTALDERRGDAAAASEGDESAADEQAAEQLIRRRSAALGRVVDPRVRRQRAYALLARNGFGPDVAARVATRWAAAAATGDQQDADFGDSPSG